VGEEDTVRREPSQTMLAPMAVREFSDGRRQGPDFSAPRATGRGLVVVQSKGDLRVAPGWTTSGGAAVRGESAPRVQIRARAASIRPDGASGGSRGSGKLQRNGALVASPSPGCKRTQPHQPT
jgi:hypothetical protein